MLTMLRNQFKYQFMQHIATSLFVCIPIFLPPLFCPNLYATKSVVQHLTQTTVIYALSITCCTCKFLRTGYRSFYTFRTYKNHSGIINITRDKGQVHELFKCPSYFLTKAVALHTNIVLLFLEKIALRYSRCVLSLR